MKKHKSFIFLNSIIIMFSAVSLYSQTPNYRFENISVNQGLSQSAVTTILQDRLGFMWFGTQEGLNRYDGYSIEIFKYDADDPNSFSGGQVLSMIEDKSGTFWIGTGDGLCRYEKDKNKWSLYSNNPSDENSLDNSIIRVVFEDTDGTIWIATRTGLNKYNEQKDNFIRYGKIFKEAGHKILAPIEIICEDMNNNLWFSVRNSGIMKMDKKTGKLMKYIHDPRNSNSLCSNMVTSMSVDKDNNLWILTLKGLNKYIINDNKFLYFDVKLRSLEEQANTGFSPIYADKKGNVWIACLNGLKLYDKEKNRIINFSEEIGYKEFDNNPIISIYEDRSGILWIGTFANGVYKYDTKKNNFFNVLKPFTFGKEKISPLIWGISVDDKDNIWIPSERYGLIKYDRIKNIFSKYTFVNQKYQRKVDNFILIYKDRSNNFWLTSDVEGLCYLESSTMKFKVIGRDYEDEKKQVNKIVTTIFEDRYGKIWIGKVYGLSRYDKEKNIFERIQRELTDSLENRRTIVFAICEDNDSGIWFATSNGLCHLDRKTNKVNYYRNNPVDNNTILKGYLTALYYDPSGILWIGGLNGLDKFEIGKNNFTHFNEKKSLINNLVHTIVSDNDGNLWISTNKGLSKFDPKKNTFSTYDESNGLQGNEFNQSSFYKSLNGELFFGGVNGITSFFPDKIKNNTTIPPILITGFRKYDKLVSFEKDISKVNEVVLNYDEIFFSFEFIALNYSSTPKNQYTYKMEGFDKDWIMCGTRRQASYTNLDPGKYIFRVKGSNNDGIWNEEGISINVVIKPPFWMTWWFRLLGVLLLVSVVFVAYSARIKSMKNKAIFLEKQVEERTKDLSEINMKMSDQNVELKSLNDDLFDKNRFIEHQNEELIVLKKDLEIKADQAEQANRAKSEFLANMSHEIRTPMNAILGFAEILSDKETNIEKKNYTNIILSSGNALLTIINDILDLSKIEAGKLILQPSYIDLKKIVEEIKQLFTQKVNEKGLEFLIDVNPDLPRGIFLDEVRIRQVIMNLLGNAIKFTEKGFIKITASTTPRSNDKMDITLTIVDTGIGIPKEQIEKIFKPFEQVEGQSNRKFGGTGLGLSISMKLIKMMGGEISAASEDKKGSIFTISLPGILSLQDVDSNLLDQKASEMNVEFEPAKVLIVDDVLANRELVKAYLEEYNLKIIEADSGEQALKEIDKDKYDLVLLDWKMPGMDGEEVARIIKEDESTKNIPVVIFTASALKEEEERISKTVNGFLKKPLNKLKLVQEIKKYLPYKEKIRIIEETSNEEPENTEESLAPEQKEKLIGILERDHQKEWGNASKTKAMGSVKTFATNLQKTAGEYGSGILKKYSTEILESLNSFKVTKVKTILGNFPKLIEKIKS